MRQYINFILLLKELNMTADQIIATIKQTRIKKGYTQVYMAEKLSITQSMYGNYENGKSQMTLKKLFKIFDILDVDLYELLSIIRQQEDVDIEEAIETLKQVVQELEYAQRRLKRD